jgi:hypothetical protein
LSLCPLFSPSSDFPRGTPSLPKKVLLLSLLNCSLEPIGDTLNDFDEILAEHFSPEAAKSGSRNGNIDSLDFENSDDLNNIIEKYETMLRLEPATKS